MLFKDIAKNSAKYTKEMGEIDISHITANYNNVTKNSVYVAIVGKKFKGTDFVKEAFTKGASICVVPNGCILDNMDKNSENLCYVDNSREFLGKSIFTLHRDILPKNLITVTGTNGKSSVSFFASQLLTSLNIPNMVIGTLGVYINNEKVAECITTPDAESLLKYFITAKKQNISYILMESSSHGIEQNRIAGLNFVSAGFTNLSQDHLDYHKSIKNYYEVKSKLFMLNTIKNYAIINVDDEYGEKLYQVCKENNIKALSYGFKASDFTIKTIHKNNNYQNLLLTYKNKNYKLGINLFGEFQSYNVLCAVGLLVASGIDIIEIITYVQNIYEVAGRLNLVNGTNGRKIFIDYAHTPSALEQVLIALKKDNPAKLKVLFGCGGNRDITKRFLMGKIASEVADVIYITDDNPRNEDPYSIRAQILEGVRFNFNHPNYFNIADRKEAIKIALQSLQVDETLLIAGKGHESGQIIREKILPFNDKEVVKEILGID